MSIIDRVCLLDGWEVIFFVIVVWELVDEWTVFEDVFLNERLHVNEISRMKGEEILDSLLTFAPIGVCGRVDAVSDADGGKSIFFHENVLVKSHIITVFEA